jgi:uncharacterized membrane protein
MLRVKSEITINRPVEEVFEFVTKLENIPLWAPKIEGIEKLTPGPIGVGTEFVEIADFPLGKPQVRWQIIEFKENQECVYQGESFIGWPRIAYRFKSDAQTTRSSVEVEARLRPFFQLLKPILRRAALKDREAVLKRLKEIIEAEVVIADG